MAPIDPRLYKPERTTVIHYATKGTAEHFSKLGWGKGRGRGRLTAVGMGALDSPLSNTFFFRKSVKGIPWPSRPSTSFVL